MISISIENFYYFQDYILNLVYAKEKMVNRFIRQSINQSINNQKA